MRFYDSEAFDLKLPPSRRFPGDKYGKLRQALLQENILREDQLVSSPTASVEDVRLVRDP